MLENLISGLTNVKAMIIIATAGIVTYFTGLASPFMGDDQGQIVNNPLIHSVSATNIRLLFDGGTFYNGGGAAPLIGTYYRPLMMVAYSMLYTVFGSHTVGFHLFQLAIVIASAMLLYLVFRYSFAPTLALLLSLVFLVHPINSEVVFGLPALQDALFFFFGILALWLLLRFQSIRSLYLVALCLALSLFSKEAGLLFVLVIILCLFMFDQRKRLYAFMGIMVLPIALWLLLKVHAVGFDATPSLAPVASLSLGGRLMTTPAIMLFYITKFIFPLKLATAYNWIYPTFSFQHVLLPLVIDLAVVATFVFLATVVHKKASKAMFYTYLFFAAWTIIGLLAHMQILRLDMTASETWFYFPMVGLLGMIGAALTVFEERVNPIWVLVVAALLIGILGIRTAVRGTDWRNEVILSEHDIAASKEDYAAYSVLSYNFFQQNDYTDAKAYAQQSVDIHPYFTNYTNLANALSNLGDYAGAQQAYTQALKYGQPFQIYEGLGLLTMVYGDTNANRQLLTHALGIYPKDPNLWLSLAILDEKNKDNVDARVAISKAASFGQVSQITYNGIMNDKPFAIGVDGENVAVP
jgi:protein O-mannosyl-transferase